MRSPCLAELAPQLGSVCQLREPIGKLPQVSGRDQQSRASPIHDVCRSAGIRGHDGTSRRERLDERDGRPLVRGRESDRIAGTQDRADVASEPREPDDIGDAELILGTLRDFYGYLHSELHLT